MVDLELINAQWQAQQERDTQETIVLARNYYDGVQGVKLSERQREFLGFQDSGRFCLNYCKTVVQSVAERLVVTGFTASDHPAGQEEASPTEVWAADVWQRNRMDLHQMTVHQGTVRDGEYFVMVDYPEGAEFPRLRPHQRYTAADVEGVAGYNGDGFGCKIHYPEGDLTLPAEYGSKRWTETVTDAKGGRITRQRMTLYFPDHFERYVMKAQGTEAGWVACDADGNQVADGQNVEDWVDKAGDPLGIPIIPFFNPSQRTELWDAVPPQDNVNKAAVDLIAAADAAGVPIKICDFTPTTDGKPPESDGGNYLKLSPGALWEIPDGKKVVPLESADLTQLLNTLDDAVIRLGQVTDTPMSRFQQTRQVKSEGTLKQEEAPLIAKIENRQVRFGNSWEDVLYLARKLQNIYGGGSLDESVLIETQWQPAAVRDEKSHIEMLSMGVEKMGVPVEMAWKKSGLFTQAEVEEMKQSAEYQARIAQKQNAALGLGMMGNTEDG